MTEDRSASFSPHRIFRVVQSGDHQFDVLVTRWVDAPWVTSGYPEPREPLINLDLYEVDYDQDHDHLGVVRCNIYQPWPGVIVFRDLSYHPPTGDRAAPLTGDCFKLRFNTTGHPYEFWETWIDLRGEPTRAGRRLQRGGRAPGSQASGADPERDAYREDIYQVDFSFKDRQWRLVAPLVPDGWQPRRLRGMRRPEVLPLAARYIVAVPPGGRRAYGPHSPCPVEAFRTQRLASFRQQYERTQTRMRRDYLRAQLLGYIDAISQSGFDDWFDDFAPLEAGEDWTLDQLRREKRRLEEGIDVSQRLLDLDARELRRDFEAMFDHLISHHTDDERLTLTEEVVACGFLETGPGQEFATSTAHPMSAQGRRFWDFLLNWSRIGNLRRANAAGLKILGDLFPSWVRLAPPGTLVQALERRLSGRMVENYTVRPGVLREVQGRPPVVEAVPPPRTHRGLRVLTEVDLQTDDVAARRRFRYWEVEELPGRMEGAMRRLGVLLRTAAFAVSVARVVDDYRNGRENVRNNLDAAGNVIGLASDVIQLQQFLRASRSGAAIPEVAASQAKVLGRISTGVGFAVAALDCGQNVMEGDHDCAFFHALTGLGIIVMEVGGPYGVVIGLTMTIVGAVGAHFTDDTPLERWATSCALGRRPEKSLEQSLESIQEYINEQTHELEVRLLHPGEGDTAEVAFTPRVLRTDCSLHVRVTVSMLPTELFGDSPAEEGTYDGNVTDIEARVRHDHGHAREIVLPVRLRGVLPPARRPVRRGYVARGEVQVFEVPSNRRVWRQTFEARNTPL